MVFVLIGCVVDESPQGGIPAIGFNESIEGTDTLLINESSPHQMKNLTFPPLQNSYTLGNLVEFDFDYAQISLLDTTKTLSSIDSIFIEITDNNKTIIVGRGKIDSTIGFKTDIGLFSSYKIPIISSLGLSEYLPQVRFKLKKVPQISLFVKVRLIFKLGRVTGYVS